MIRLPATLPGMPRVGADRLQTRVGARIAAVRESAGVTQEDLASRLGITARNVQRVEAGSQNLTLQTIERFVRAMGMDPNVVLTIPEGRLRGGPAQLHAVPDRGDGRAPTAVPILAIDVAAGYARSGRVPSALGWTLLSDRVDGRAFVTQVTGRSMEPLIPERSWSLFRAVDTISVGRIALFEVQLRGEADDRAYVVKKLAERTRKRIVLASANPAFAATELDENRSGGVRIIAEWIRVVS